MRLGEIVMYASDFERTVGFYRDGVGLPVRFEGEGMVRFEVGEVTLLVHEAGGDRPPPLPTFVVQDIEGTARELRSRGVTVEPVREFGWGRWPPSPTRPGTRLALEEPAGGP